VKTSHRHLSCPTSEFNRRVAVQERKLECYPSGNFLFLPLIGEGEMGQMQVIGGPLRRPKSKSYYQERNELRFKRKKNKEKRRRSRKTESVKTSNNLVIFFGRSAVDLELWRQMKSSSSSFEWNRDYEKPR